MQVENTTYTLTQAAELLGEGFSRETIRKAARHLIEQGSMEPRWPASAGGKCRWLLTAAELELVKVVVAEWAPKARSGRKPGARGKKQEDKNKNDFVL